ncbi:MAG: PD-(D/E)XK nuclease family protein, partial [Candidatus Fonsibacter sp.]
IIIENKIYADLGDNQIYNYCKWAEDELGHGVVFYLALNDTDTAEKLNESGKSPNGGKNYKLNEDFFRITYDM